MDNRIITDMLGEMVYHVWHRGHDANPVTAQIKAIYFNKDGELTFLVHNLGDGNLEEVPAYVCSQEV